MVLWPLGGNVNTNLKILLCLTFLFSMTSLIYADENLVKNNRHVVGDIEIISQAIEKDGSADVIVWLRDNQYTSPDYTEDFVKKRSEIAKVENEVLSVFLPEEFKLRFRYIVNNGFSGTVTKEGFEKLLMSPLVEEIYLNGVFHKVLAESRPLINASVVDNMGVTGSGIGVCVLDTGVDYTHPALGGCFGPGCKVIMGYDFCNGASCSGFNDSDPMDEDGHGTHVSGIIASSDSTYKGISPNVKIAALKVMNASGDGTWDALTAGLDFCTLYAQTFNIKIMTMSLGGGGPYGKTASPCPNYSNKAILTAFKNGIFVDVASGNSGFNNGVSYPACAPGATSVGATDDVADTIVSFTNLGIDLDLLAPGSVIDSTALGGGFVAKSGTSMAAPHVAGVAALMYELNPALAPKTIEAIMQVTGVPRYGILFSKG